MSHRPYLFSDSSSVSKTSALSFKSRDFFKISSNNLPKENQRPAFLETLEDLKYFQKCYDQLNDIPRTKFQHLIWIGIGGSSLGPKVISEFFDFKSQIHFLENPDISHWEKIISRGVEPEKSLIVVVSKSGKTLETLAWASLIASRLGLKSLQGRLVVISDPDDNPLNRWAKMNHAWRFEFPSRLGGRYSVLSATGLLVAWFLGLDCEKLVLGARSSLEQEQTFNLVDRFSEEALASFERQEWISFFWGYQSNFKEMGAWIQQLWAESLAKSVDLQNHPAKRVSTPFVALGSVDQHSLLQQVVEGARDKWIILIGVEPNPSRLLEDFSTLANISDEGSIDFCSLLGVLREATKLALKEKGISYFEMIAPKPNLEVLGAQFLFWELVVATLAQNLNINAYDQPGVELAKKYVPGLLR